MVALGAYCVLAAVVLAIGAWMGLMLPVGLWIAIDMAAGPVAVPNNALLVGGCVLLAGAWGATLVRRYFYLQTRWLNAVTGFLGAMLWLLGAVWLAEGPQLALGVFLRGLNLTGALSVLGATLLIFAPWDCMYRWVSTRTWQSPGYRNPAADIRTMRAKVVDMLFTGLGGAAFLGGTSCGGMLARTVLDTFAGQDFPQAHRIWNFFITLGLALPVGFGAARAMAVLQFRVQRRLRAAAAPGTGAGANN